MQSMTGFGSREIEVAPFGKICVEIRSANHKFLDMVFHLPEGFLSLEDKIKREIESKVKRGRITCAVCLVGAKTPVVSINKDLLKKYVAMLKGVKNEFHVKDEVSINTLVHLPGVLSLEEDKIAKTNLWPRLKPAVVGALNGLVKTRQKEGNSLHGYLKSRASMLKNDLVVIKARFKKAIKEKMGELSTDEERSSFLRDADISEEIERLSFHIRNFQNKLSKTGPIGKELDFIAQEMQREANTLAAKSFDLSISARIVQSKSQIEKVREQVQNAE